MSLTALLLDLDGTLVDTNMFHVELWGKALKKLGYHVAPDRIFAEIGKGGDNVVPSLLGKDAEEKHGDELRDVYLDLFKSEIKTRRAAVFPGAVDLLKSLRARKIKTCLATSSSKEQLELIEQSAGVKFSELTDAFTTADDAERSKPAPDIVSAAAAKLNCSPAECAMVGDTPYDATSAKHAGVVTIALTCGGHSAEELLSAGARLVYRDCADLLAHLDDALHIASPAAFALTNAKLSEFMSAALQAASDGLDDGGAPIGAAIFNRSGDLLSAAFNESHQTQNKTDHAEIVAFRRSAGKVPLEAKDLILVSTLEPCVMCLGAAMEAGVDTVVYALKAPADSGTGRVNPPRSPESQMPRIVGNIRANESRSLFEKFVKIAEPGPALEFAKQLLKLTEKSR
jgi:HAD superfamily hydrolase (TIGR01509 family)